MDAGLLAALGGSNEVSPKIAQSPVPEEEELSLSSYPNPFNPSTQVRFVIPQDSFVRLNVFDLLGREVATLVNDFKTAGVHYVRFDASALSSGLYLYRLEAADKIATQKILLLK